METQQLIIITYSFFIVIIYCANLVEALNIKIFKKIMLILVFLYNLLIILFFILNPTASNLTHYTILVIFILSISIIALINKNIFEFFTNVLSAKLDWNRITHRIFFPLSLYVLIYPFTAFIMERNLAIIILSETYDILNLLGFQITMFLLSFVGIGLATRRTFKQCVSRLEIRFPNLKYAILGVVALFLIDYMVWGIMGVFSQFFGGGIAQKTIEESSNVENTVNMIRQVAPSTLNLAIVSIVVGISEELLFRGALQPRFGNLYTSILFSSLHFQYLSVIALIEIFIISYILGIIKEKTSTSTTIIIHIIYDFISLMKYLP